MLFFPLRTDRRQHHLPWVNYALIAANVVIFILTRGRINAATAKALEIQAEQLKGASAQHITKLLQDLQDIGITDFYVQPHAMQLYQFFTYQFLHADIFHLLGNMVFLYVFGNAVEDRLGKVGYTLFYLTSGVIAALAHAAIESSPMLGASGSIAGVTGMYLAMFPLSVVTIFYWFIFFGSFEVTSVVLILFRVGYDFVMQMAMPTGVAYLAHLGGYAFGFIAGLGLLVGRVVPREPYDMLALIERRRRRAQFQLMTRRGFQPWQDQAGENIADSDGELTPDQQELAARRAVIASTITGKRDIRAAAELYAQLLTENPDQVMSQQQQLDLAGQFMAEEEYATAAAAYELFLRYYPRYHDKTQIQLILGLIYGRYLDQKQRARELLKPALGKLSGHDKEHAEAVLTEIGD